MEVIPVDNGPVSRRPEDELAWMMASIRLQLSGNPLWAAAVRPVTDLVIDGEEFFEGCTYLLESWSSIQPDGSFSPWVGIEDRDVVMDLDETDDEGTPLSEALEFLAMVPATRPPEDLEGEFEDGFSGEGEEGCGDPACPDCGATASALGVVRLSAFIGEEGIHNLLKGITSELTDGKGVKDSHATLRVIRGSNVHPIDFTVEAMHPPEGAPPGVEPELFLSRRALKTNLFVTAKDLMESLLNGDLVFVVPAGACDASSGVFGYSAVKKDGKKRFASMKPTTVTAHLPKYKGLLLHEA